MNAKKLFDLSGKVIIITGAAGNLGSQYAEGLSQAGANVVLGDLDYTKCKQLSMKLKKKYVFFCYGFNEDCKTQSGVPFL